MNRPPFDASPSEWLVYADHLQQRNNPLGELIALNDAAFGGIAGELREQFLAEHRAELCDHLAGNVVQFEWWRFFASEVRLRVSPDDNGLSITSRFLDSPIAALAQSISLVGVTPTTESMVELGPALENLARRLPPGCTSISLIDERAEAARTTVSADYEPALNLVDFGSLEPLWRHPNLTSLTLHVANPDEIEFGDVEAPALRRFGLFGLRFPVSYTSLYFDNDLLATLESASWPELESFSLRLPERYTVQVADNRGSYIPVERYQDHWQGAEGHEDGYHEPVGWAGEIGPVLGALPDSLSHLALHSFASSRLLLEALEGCYQTRRIRELDLSESDLNDSDAAWMIHRSDLFENLQMLDLSNTRITRKMAATLNAELSPRVLHSPGGAEHRYVVGRE